MKNLQLTRRCFPVPWLCFCGRRPPFCFSPSFSHPNSQCSRLSDAWPVDLVYKEEGSRLLNSESFIDWLIILKKVHHLNHQRLHSQSLSISLSFRKLTIFRRIGRTANWIVVGIHFWKLSIWPCVICVKTGGKSQNSFLWPSATLYKQPPFLDKRLSAQVLLNRKSLRKLITQLFPFLLRGLTKLGRAVFYLKNLFGSSLQQTPWVNPGIDPLSVNSALVLCISLDQNLVCKIRGKQEWHTEPHLLLSQAVQSVKLLYLQKADNTDKEYFRHYSW